MGHTGKARRAAAAALLLAAALAAPPVAAASSPAGAQPYTAQLRDRLGQSITDALRTRALRFDNADRRIGERITRVRALAVTVKAAGGDVSGALNMLSLAEESLADAEAVEDEAVEQFEAVPVAADRRAAFAAARATGRRAVDRLRESRQRVLGAAAELRRISAELRGVAAQ